MSDQFNEAREQATREIARKYLRLGRLKVRNMDACCSIESIRAALEAAYTAGYSAAKEEK